MKKIFTLACASMLLITSARSQVVINEVYCSPNAGNHEFFELFNVDIGATPTPVDGLTVVTYFESGSTKGFYVLDLPALSIQPRGYLVGSAANPFDYQSESNSTATSFSWNDPALSTNSGYLEKWVRTGTDATDGNADYNLAAVPANFNDLFYRKSGGQFSYAIFIFSNGILVNSFYGGSNSSAHPALITGMPDLNLNYIVGGVSHPFTVNFDNLPAAPAEHMVSDAGTDNGYIRDKDGLCNTWVKSSSSVTHTPNVTNGSSVGGTGTVTISGLITRGIAPSTTSTVQYDIIAGTSSEFPVELRVYLDNGSVSGELDATDTYLTSTIQNSVAEPGATLTFSPVNANILVVAKTAAGCYGQVRYLSAANQTLPVKLISFNSFESNNKVTLTWKVEENETVDRFEVERSVDGTSFYKVSTIYGREETGVQQYVYAEAQSKEKTYFRLKMFDEHQKMEYSKVIAASNGNSELQTAKILQNPFNDKIQVVYNSNGRETIQMKVVDMTGKERMRKSIDAYPGSNQLIMNIDQQLTPGIYVLVLSSRDDRQSLKVIKR